MTYFLNGACRTTWCEAASACLLRCCPTPLESVLTGKLHLQFPTVALNIVRAERSKTLELVLNREAAFGVASLPIKDPRLHLETIHEDTLELVVPSGHPLTLLKSITLAQVGKYGFLIPKQGRRRESLDHLFAQNKITRRITMELDSNELLKRLILAGLGVGFLPRINIAAEIKQGILETVPIMGVELPRKLALISLRDLELTRAGRAFFSFATSSVRSPHSAEKIDASFESLD